MKYRSSEELIQVLASGTPIAKATIRPWGNSLALRFPSEVLKLAKLGEGVEVGFHLSNEGEVVIRPVYPPADDQQGLRALFLSLRESAQTDVKSHEDDLYEPMGDERF